MAGPVQPRMPKQQTSDPLATEATSRTTRHRRTDCPIVRGEGERHFLLARAGTLVPDELEQAALARMKDLRSDGASFRTIAATLEVEGHAPKRRQHWHPMTIRQALAR